MRNVKKQGSALVHVFLGYKFHPTTPKMPGGVGGGFSQFSAGFMNDYSIFDFICAYFTLGLQLDLLDAIQALL